MKPHWEQVYAAKAAHSVSWFQERAACSLRLIRTAACERGAAIIDVGGGASTLIDDLLAEDYDRVSVLDISPSALAAAQRRLGERAGRVQWLEADIMRAELPSRHFDVWHDRAVFHFLTTPEARAAYLAVVAHAVKPGGHVIIATFAEDGPEQCSGLPVVRYGAESLHAEFGAGFALLHHEREAHRTPFGTVQPFVYCHFRKLAP